MKLALVRYPGVWRDPHWIADQITLRIERGAKTLQEAVDRVCDANQWRHQLIVGGARRRPALLIEPIAPSPNLVEVEVP